MKNKQLAIGALLSYFTIAFNVISGLLYTPWIIRTIGDDQYALYALALSIINIFLIDFGIGSAITKFLSGYYARGERERADYFMGIVYKTFIAISAGIALILAVFYLFIDGIYTKFTPEELMVFKRLFIIVGVSSVVSFPFTTFNGILTASENFVALKACSLGQKVLDVLLIVAFLMAGQGVYALVLVHAVSNFAFLIVKYLLIRFKVNQRADMHQWDGKIAKDLFGYSAWYTVKMIAQRCIFNIMPSVIAILIGSEKVTLFSLAATLEGYVFLFTDAVNGMFMPRVSRIIHEHSDKKLNNLMVKVGKFHIYTLGLLIIGFACVGRQFVNLWMGDSYKGIYICALLLIIPSLLDTPQQIARTSLLVKDVVRQQSYVYLLMAAINLGLAFILVPWMGVLGAAVSVLVAYIVRTIGMNVLYHKYLPVQLGHYFIKSYGKWLIVAFITLVLGFLINHFVSMGNWLGLIIKAGLITIIYGLLLFAICLDKELKKALWKKIMKNK